MGRNIVTSKIEDIRKEDCMIVFGLSKMHVHVFFLGSCFT